MAQRCFGLPEFPKFSCDKTRGLSRTLIFSPHTSKSLHSSCKNIRQSKMQGIMGIRRWDLTSKGESAFTVRALRALEQLFWQSSVKSPFESDFYPENFTFYLSLLYCLDPLPINYNYCMPMYWNYSVLWLMRTSSWQHIWRCTQRKINTLSNWWEYQSFGSYGKECRQVHHT